MRVAPGPRMRSFGWGSPLFATCTFALLFLARCGGKVEVDGSPPPTAEDSGSDGGVPCRSSADCASSSSGGLPGVCYGPINPASICIRAESCSSDKDCADYSGSVCSTGAGAQAADGGPSCRPPCTSNQDCNYWESCQPDGTCQPFSCENCPSYLSCTRGECGPKSCKTDSDCPGAYCVDDTCFATLGTCGGSCG
jgi:hypothetical protein